MPSKSIIRSCEHCGKTFRAPVANVAKGFGRFCSRECGFANHREDPRAVICPHCSETFLTKDKRQVYCSKACSGHANSGVNHYRWKGRFTDHYGYIFVYAPNHPSANRRGYVREHIFVATSELGRHLSADECVHHINGIRNDNRLENLQVLTFKEHATLHMADASERYTNEELTESLHEMRRRLGRNPRKRDVDIFPDLPGRKAFERHFGTWNEALQAAGLPVNMIRPH